MASRKVKELSVIDGRRAQNCIILLSKYVLPLPLCPLLHDRFLVGGNAAPLTKQRPEMRLEKKTMVDLNAWGREVKMTGVIAVSGLPLSAVPWERGGCCSRTLF